MVSAFPSLLVSLLIASVFVSAANAGTPTAEPAKSPPEETRPNLLLIMAEDLSPRLGTYGDPVARTPNLDRLAGQGVRFDRAFTTAGVCAPSRAAIIMGVHQNRFGAGHMRAARGGYVAVPPADWKAFPETLRAAGYYTLNNRKTDYQMSDRFGGTIGGPSTIWDEPSADDWSNAPADRPFFAYLTLDATHESQVWPTWHIKGLMPLLMMPLRLMNHWHWPIETDPARVPVPPTTRTRRRCGPIWLGTTTTSRVSMPRLVSGSISSTRRAGRATRWWSSLRTMAMVCPGPSAGYTTPA